MIIIKHLQINHKFGIKLSRKIWSSIKYINKTINIGRKEKNIGYHSVLHIRKLVQCSLWQGNFEAPGEIETYWKIQLHCWTCDKYFMNSMKKTRLSLNLYLL